MLLRLIAAGTRMPAWVRDGFADYAQRLQGDYQLQLVEIPVSTRSGTDIERAIKKEGDRMLDALSPSNYVVTLQVTGRMLSTSELAKFLEQRALDSRCIDFCIGGPDGLDPRVDAKAQLRWSLSALTLPHALVRVIAAEALYRAVSVIKGLPYHRA